ncbi:amylo-alpha-1,6-glucosidase [Desulfococcus sp.]|uniref:amylo-alpha-1,6-glucosidase n=1 Tax=Desulfococcus sp. TaxID=2025834 RepID=UPI0035932F5C
MVKFRGDTVTVVLEAPESWRGSAWLRTNIGQAAVARREIIREVLHDESPLSRDWFDIPMRKSTASRFEARVSLAEVGHFEAKAYFLPDGDPDPVWPGGANSVFNVAPADCCCGNIVYNAFVRQFGPNKADGAEAEMDPVMAECVQRMDRDGYTVIPRSGTFRDLIRELDFILCELGCRYVQLLPIHPTPTTYGRMGRFGSPYAALSFTEVDPALAVFDPKATPLEQFIELLDAVHARGGRLIMDIAINHTGWAAALHETHPQWLSRDEDGRIEMPGAWGVTWADLTKLDYRHRDLWVYMADVFLTWCRRGVDGFRCDAGYMVPEAAWMYITARVREEYPDTIFFLEGLGGKISVTRDLLNRANLNWAYSELFQNYDRGQIAHYLSEAWEIHQCCGLLIHFAETHDNNRLAARSKTWARMRTALCALFSLNGGFAFANGVEWFAREKIRVHDAPSLNWGSEENQVFHIRRLNGLLKNHPAFHDQVAVRMIQQGEGNGLALLRHHLPTDQRLIILVNLDDGHPVNLAWERQPDMGDDLRDLLSGRPVYLKPDGATQVLELRPGQVLCLGAGAAGVWMEDPPVTPDRVWDQRFRAKVMDVHRFYHGTGDMGGFDLAEAAGRLKTHPAEFCRAMNPEGEDPRVVSWRWPEDLRRAVMIPPDHFLLVLADAPFRAGLVDGGRVLAREESLPREAFPGGGHGPWFALFAPTAAPESHRPGTLRLTVYAGEGTVHREAPLLFLSRPENARIRRGFRRGELLARPLLFLGTNGRGGMLRAHASWGKLSSRYDALLAGNLNPLYPEDRWVMFTRCRAWVVYQGFSYEIGLDCLDAFRVDDGAVARWRYQIPTGQGEDISLSIAARMIPGENAVRISFYRHPGLGTTGRLSDDRPVRIILRPDIEDRNFHDTTKAFTGPEHRWPGSAAAGDREFVFTPAPDRRLIVEISRGAYVSDPEWQYMVHRPLEAERGLDPDSDLFSPGYFKAPLSGGETLDLFAQILGRTRLPMPTDTLFSTTDHKKADPPETAGRDLSAGLRGAVENYIVRRGDFSTVIAGYPWFLDWGRDTLIAARGLIAAGKIRETGEILLQFARFEKDGTLPNMIRGDDARNRDTSDAPLWFFVACKEMAGADGTFLDTDLEGRTIRDILLSMGRSIVGGTPNGIRMDPESGLVFSPSHFTWMDTNHPAGTPRQGYPIEIQALWHYALSFLARISGGEPSEPWRGLAEKVRDAIARLYYLKDEGYLSDCLHAQPGESARQAAADDALRPNQLFALTLGAVADPVICRGVLDACLRLLVPGAIRSLADKPAVYPLEILHQGRRLGDPHQPYRGNYAGDEDTMRKPAYHNGTAWTWVFPSFCEAWADHYGDSGKAAARAWLSSAAGIINAHCAGHMPEILDGDYPHRQRGCDAQAWGDTELLRVWLKVSG